MPFKAIWYSTVVLGLTPSDLQEQHISPVDSCHVLQVITSWIFFPDSFSMVALNSSKESMVSDKCKD